MQPRMIKLLRNKMIPAILAIVLGVILIFAQKSALDLLVKIIGILMLVGAVFSVLMYLLTPYRDSMQLMTAACGAVVGVFLFANPGVIVNIFPVMMGIVVILNGLSNLAKALSDRTDVLFTVLCSIVMIVCGLLILIHPGVIADAIVLTIGVTLLVSGIMDLAMLHRIRSSLLIQ